VTDESKLRQDAARARKADALLNDELLTEAFAKLKEGYLTQWEATTVEQQFLREKYWLAARMVGVVKDHLITVVANGKLASTELKRIEDEAERKKRFGIL
jgi:predicted kinase